MGRVVVGGTEWPTTTMFTAVDGCCRMHAWLSAVSLGGLLGEEEVEHALGCVCHVMTRYTH